MRYLLRNNKINKYTLIRKDWIQNILTIVFFLIKTFGIFDY